MNGVHDMGGMHGFGPVVAERNEPVFHAQWEGIVRAIFERGNKRYFNLDEFRRAMERMPADAYLRASYYERWLYALESILQEKGVVSGSELASGHSALAPPAANRSQGPAPSQPARFNPGDRVVTRNLNPEGHTRLPRYARAKHGVIRKHHGSYPLPDANAHGKGPHWEPCYVVEFEATELWGPNRKSGDRVCLDVWESYLEPEARP